MSDKLSTVETIFIDESGTPTALNEEALFVVGGFSIRGDVNPILKAWDKFLNERTLYAKKGRKYNENEFLDLSYFMCTNDIIPLTSYSYLNEDDINSLNLKIKNYKLIAKQIKSRTLNINATTYLWALQVGVTIAGSVISLLINRGEISKIKLSVDRYLSNNILKSIVEYVVINFFEPTKFNEFIRSDFGRFIHHPDTNKLLSNFKPEYEFITLSLNARGKFKILADAVCAMYRKCLRGDSGARRAWDLIKICYTRNNKIPFCIGNKVTKEIREIVRTPWSIPNH